MSADITGQKRMNKNGGWYINGKPLPSEIRRQIIDKWLKGEKVTAIASDLHVTHGVVSKITREYKETKQYEPRTRSSRISKKKTPNFSIDSILSSPTEPSTLPSSSRSLFTSQQKSVLNSFYAKNKYPSEDEKLALIETTGLSKGQVTTWFNNKRGRSSKSDDSTTVSESSDQSISTVSSLSIDSVESSPVVSTNILQQQQHVNQLASLVMFQQVLQNMVNPIFQNMATTNGEQQTQLLKSCLEQISRHNQQQYLNSLSLANPPAIPFQLPQLPAVFRDKNTN